MGNVFAASSPGISLPVPEPILSDDSQKQPNVPSDKPDVSHPGVMEDLHKRTRDVFPINFDGIKFLVNKGLSNHFQVSHTINLSSAAQTGYRFGATYVGTKQSGPNEAFPVFLGDIDPSGNMNANILHQFGKRVRCKFVCQFSQLNNQPVSATQFQTDYMGDMYTASVTFANMDVTNEAGLIVGQYLHSVNKKVALGAELIYQFGPQVPGHEIALLSLAGRYNGADNAFSGTLGSHALHLCYYQKASEQLQLGCELESNFRSGESTASLGYQIDLPKADLLFKGMVDSNWNVGAVFEKKLGALPFIFTLSGTINHVKQNYKLGCGFIIR